MPVPTTADDLLALINNSGVADLDHLAATLESLRAAGALPAAPKVFAARLVERGVVSNFQAEQLLQGRWRGFSVGKYHILERIGSGGMGVVYLAEHKILHRRVALKVLPLTLAADPWFLERFYREAQAIAALQHPNIVHAHDVDQDGDLHFIVFEYVEGSSLQYIVAKHGPMAVERVPHYIRQAALGLEHAHRGGLVHRDIKPGNLLLDRRGVIKILDMGLAHFFARAPAEVFASGDKAKRIVGTDDYLAPEQIVDSDDVDVRADIYGLGGTSYFLLTGRVPFHDVPDEHKFIWHLTRRPRPIREVRPEVPEALAAVFERMMAKNPWERYQRPVEVAQALAPWIQTPILAPPAEEMPGLSPAAQRLGSGSSAARRAPGRSSWVILPSPTPAPAQAARPLSPGDPPKAAEAGPPDEPSDR